MSDEQKPLYTRRFGPQVVQSTFMSLDEVRSRASKLNRIVRVRTWIQGPTHLIAIGAFGALVFMVSNPITRVSACLICIGWGYVFYEIMSSHGRAPAQLPTEGDAASWATLYRSALERERDYLRHVAIWFPLVFSATVVVILVTFVRTTQLKGTPFIIMMAVIWALLVPFHIRQNLGRARRFQREIDKANASLSPAVGN
ncbi:MAG: hypothetical protein ACREV7_22965 [Steroidobacteraceae bacterium]